jgi:membrane-associated phospholipid phosphatase
MNSKIHRFYFESLPSNWALPLFLTEKNRHPIVAASALLAALVYMLSNHFHLYPPQLLPLSWVDQATPFLPQTVWMYMSEYVFFLAVYLACEDMTNLNKYLYSIMTLQFVSVIIFTLWPTTYPRELYPLPHHLDAITYSAFDSLRAADSPASCCPSLHVSSVFLSAFIFLDDRRDKFPFYLIWATLIALSTLTTKQHYVLDVISGLLLAIGMYGFFHKLVPYRKRSLSQTSALHRNAGKKSPPH